MSDIIQGSAGAENGTIEQVGRDQEVRGGTVRRLSESLSEPQQRALGLLMEGTAIREVGQQLGIHRGTIYRWVKSDPYFRAAYNAWQLEQQESCRAALMKAAEEAVQRVVGHVRFDPNLAWRLIKELGILSRPKPLSVKPSRVEMEIALEDHEEESVLLKRIDHEVANETDLTSPRGDLGRLLRLKNEAELGSITNRPEPTPVEGDAGGNPPVGLSRE